MNKLYHFKNTSITILFMISTITLYAQEIDYLEFTPKHNSIDLFFGVQTNQSQDLVFSPMIYRGTNLGVFGLAYERADYTNIFRVDFTYPNNQISPKETINSPVFGEREASSSNQFSISASYLKKVNREGKAEFYAGGKLNARFNEVNFLFGLGEEDSYTYENSINPMFLMKHPLNLKTKLVAEVYFPLVAFIARPPYAIVDNETIQGQDGIGYLYKSGSFHSWGKFRAMNFSIELNRAFSNSIAGFIRYRLAYWHFAEPDKLRVLNNTIDLGTSFKF